MTKAWTNVLTDSMSSKRRTRLSCRIQKKHVLHTAPSFIDVKLLPDTRLLVLKLVTGFQKTNGYQKVLNSTIRICLLTTLLYDLYTHSGFGILTRVAQVVAVAHRLVICHAQTPDHTP